MERPKPTKADLEAARKKLLRDVIGPGLDVLFVGINPGLYTTAIGHHFGRPGNRFWPALFRAGFTERLLSPWEDRTLLERRLGVTNLVARTTANAAELAPAELVRGLAALRRKIRKHRPRVVAFAGMDAYRTAFAEKKAAIGRQPRELEGAIVWVLPNPSGLNASYQLDDFGRLFGELRAFVSALSTPGTPRTSPPAGGARGTPIPSAVRSRPRSRRRGT
jgi:TDG/mug DNA glycosylase family protein